MRRFLRENSLSIVFLVLFLAALAGQAFAGHADLNEQAIQHGDPQMSMSRYVLSSNFAVDVMENWQSEYLQFTLLILLTVWLSSAARRSPRSRTRRAASPTSVQKVGMHAQPNSPRWAKVSGIARPSTSTRS